MVKDGLGREIKTVDPVGDEKLMVYDTVVAGLVEVKSIVAPNTLALTNKAQADGLGRVQKTIDAENQVSLNEFDNNGNKTKSRDANGVGLDCTFDNRNRDLICTDTQGNTVSKIFDKNNNIISQTDALGKITSFVFDARNRLSSSTNRIGSTVSNVYDANSNVLSVTDGQGNPTHYVYDQRNLQTERIFSDTQDSADKIVFTYDAVQRKSSQLDQKGDLISYQYDMANRLLQRQYPDALNDLFSYDQASRLTQAISNRYQNTVSRTYNDDSTVATEGLVTNGQNYQISHYFDSAKRNYQTTYPNGKVLSQAFTDRNQLVSVSYDAQLMANFQYDAGMRETTRGLGNGLIQVTAYRPDNLISQKSVGTFTNYSYSYDANKRKTSETDGTMASLSQTFGYDFENRLTSWSSNGTTLNQTQSWNLSLEGAWQSNTVNGVTENRSFNQTYETLNSDANAMTHDRKGNLTTNKDGSIYSWDFNNQMSFSVSGTPSVNASYAYDALGRRVSKTSNNTVTIFVNSGYQILTEYSSTSNAPFSEIQSFVFATYIDDPIAVINANGKYFYHSNQQYSIGAISDNSGNLIERFGYNAYGKPIAILDSVLVNNEYFFTGCQLDSETGLFYFRARYYDASLGQFISRDPIGYVDGKNLYSGYFSITGLDPYGLFDYDFGHINDGTWLGSGETAKKIGSWIGSGTRWPILKYIDPRNIVPNPSTPIVPGNPVAANNPLAVKKPAEGAISDPNPPSNPIPWPIPHFGFFDGATGSVSVTSGTASAAISVTAIHSFCQTCFYITISIGHTVTIQTLAQQMWGRLTSLWPPRDIGVDPNLPSWSWSFGGIVGAGMDQNTDWAGPSTSQVTSVGNGYFEIGGSDVQNSLGRYVHYVSTGATSSTSFASTTTWQSHTFKLKCFGTGDSSSSQN